MPKYPVDDIRRYIHASKHLESISSQSFALKHDGDFITLKNSVPDSQVTLLRIEKTKTRKFLHWDWGGWKSKSKWIELGVGQSHTYTLSEGFGASDDYETDRNTWYYIKEFKDLNTGETVEVETNISINPDDPNNPEQGDWTMLVIAAVVIGIFIFVIALGRKK